MLSYGPSEISAERISHRGEVISRLLTISLPSSTFEPDAAYLRNFLALNQTAMQIGLAYPKNFYQIPEYDIVLERAKKLTESWGGKLTLLDIPQSARFQGLLRHHFAYDRLRMAVIRSAQERGIKTIDLVETILNE